MADTYSFDMVCDVEMHEVKNAVDQAKKQLAVRYDFKGSKSSITLNTDNSITLIADDDYKLKSLTDILQERLAKRNIPSRALIFGNTEKAFEGNIRQSITFQSGIPTEKAREIVKYIKSLKLKVQSQIQEDKIKISGKKKDDLQEVMQAIKDKKYDIEIQFTNYR